MYHRRVITLLTTVKAISWLVTVRLGAGNYSHLALVVADKGTAMSLDDRGQCRCVEVTAGDPAWELVVPHAVVACGTHWNAIHSAQIQLTHRGEACR